jgi:hypothetical protein
VTGRADPACRTAEHRPADWSMEHLPMWRCGVCDPPTAGLARAGLVVRRDGAQPVIVAAGAPDLTADETGRLVELEQIVDRGLKTFVDVGQALGEIRDRRLYRATHQTFEAYLRDRWSISRSRGYQLIDASAVSTIVDTAGLSAPVNEAQARELVPLLKQDEQVAVEVWRELRAEHGDRVTGQTVKAAVNERIADDARRNAGLAAMKGSSSHDWGTPALILDPARALYDGAIDLDPCSSAWHQQRVRASRYFTADDNGLAQEWTAERGFVNPPFGEMSREFAAKLVHEHTAGRLAAAIFVGQPSATAGTVWFWPFWELGVVCFVRRRVEFVHPDGRVGGGPDGTILVYVGPDRDRFAAAFGDLGEIHDRRWQPEAPHNDQVDALAIEGQLTTGDEAPPAR